MMDLVLLYFPFLLLSFSDFFPLFYFEFLFPFSLFELRQRRQNMTSYVTKGVT